MTEATTAVFSCTYRRRNRCMRVVIFRDKVHRRQIDRRKAERSTTRQRHKRWPQENTFVTPFIYAHLYQKRPSCIRLRWVYYIFTMKRCRKYIVAMVTDCSLWDGFWMTIQIILFCSPYFVNKVGISVHPGKKQTIVVDLSFRCSCVFLHVNEFIWSQLNIVLLKTKRLMSGQEHDLDFNIHNSTGTKTENRK